MGKTFKNLIHVLKSFRVATVTNLLGLTLSFFCVYAGNDSCEA